MTGLGIQSTKVGHAEPANDGRNPEDGLENGGQGFRAPPLDFTIGEEPFSVGVRKPARPGWPLKIGVWMHDRED
jgi:hypothetical protein